MTGLFDRLAFAAALLLTSLALCGPGRAQDYDAIVAAPDRSDADRQTDQRRAPAKMLAFIGVKAGMKVALAGVDDEWFESELRTRTQDIRRGKPSSPCDLVFLRVDAPKDLAKIKTVKSWIEKSGAIWVVRAKGPRAALRDTDLIDAGLAAGLVDNKIVSFSETHGAMRFVFRLRDRPK